MNGLHLMYTCLRNYVESKKLQWKAGGQGGLVHDLKKIRQPSMRTCHVLWLIQAHRIRRSLENNTEEFTITNIYIHFKSRCLPLVSGFPWVDFAWQTFLLVHLFQLHLFLQLNFLWLCLNTALCEQSGLFFSNDPCRGCQGPHSRSRSWCSISMLFAEMRFFLWSFQLAVKPDCNETTVWTVNNGVSQQRTVRWSNNGPHVLQMWAKLCRYSAKVE